MTRQVIMLTHHIIKSTRQVIILACQLV